MFSFFKQQTSSLLSGLSTQISALLYGKKIDQHTLKDIDHLLIQADFGSKTTHFVLKALEKKLSILNKDTASAILQELLSSCLKEYTQLPPVILLVGINGSGKTTLAAKLAYLLQQEGKKILLTPADTFRAAAYDQLATWAEVLNVDITQSQSTDPSSVVFDGCKKFIEKNYDTLVIDTAGRLQTKQNLMQELAKLKRVITKQLPNTQICTLLVLDGTLGQNSLEQARIFHEATQVDAIVLTKMDSLSKGGIVCAISHELSLPIAYISFGEKKEALKKFKSAEFVKELLS